MRIGSLHDVRLPKHATLGTPRADPFGLAALTASGTMVAHQVGYLADADARAAHTYVAYLGPATLFAAFVAAWVAAMRILRADRRAMPSVVTLASLQLTLYALLEVGERLVLAEAVGSFASVPVVLGAVAQPVVAALAIGALRIGGTVLRAIARPRLAVRAERSHSWWPPAAVVVAGDTWRGIQLRGPPLG